MARIDDVLSRADRLLIQADLVESDIEKAKKKQDELSADLDIQEKALAVLQKLVETYFDKTVGKVTSLTTYGLQEVFDDRVLSVSAEIKERRGKLNIDVLTKDEEYGIEGSVKRNFGGGILQVQQFLLLFVFKILLKSLPFLVLDETFSMVSSEYQPNVGKLISELCKKFGVCVLLVTHNEEILPHADVVFTAYMKNNELKLSRKEMSHASKD